MAIYLDYAATCPMPDDIRQVYSDALAIVGNPSSIHQAGQHARNMVEQARGDISRLIGADPMEVSFTSGATEAINTWLKGRVFAHRRAHPQSPCYVVLTRAEHHATLDAVEWLEAQGLASPLWIDVDDDAVIDTDHLEATLAAQPTDAVAGVTTLVANNEVGSLQPFDAVADIAHRFGVALHLDAVQGFGSIPLNLAREGVDAISISAHKMGGPVGVGALAVSRNAAAVDSLIHGGGQQVSRSGTLDAAGAAAFAAAATRAVVRAAQESDTLVELRTRLSAGLSALEGVRVNGSDNKLHNNVHITMEGASGEVVLYLLDAAGVYVSTGSACQAGVAEASHVVQAMGRSHLEARSAIRLTLGESTTSDDIDTVLTLFPEVLEKAQRAGYPSA